MRQGVVWSKNKDKLGKNDEVYIVNQTLMYGDLSEISNLIKKFGKNRVRAVFIKQPLMIYSRSSANFVAKMILGINKKIDYDRYVKNLW